MLLILVGFVLSVLLREPSLFITLVFTQVCLWLLAYWQGPGAYYRCPPPSRSSGPPRRGGV